MTPIEYTQISLEAAAPEGAEPTMLSPGEMREKLAALGVEASSPLGRHALGGGRLWSRDGCAYQLAAIASSVVANAASEGPTGEEHQSPHVVQIGSMIVRLHPQHTAQSQLQALMEPSVSPRFCIRMC